MRHRSARSLTVGFGLVSLLLSAPLAAQGSPSDCLVGPVALVVEPAVPQGTAVRPTLTVAGSWCQGERPRLMGFGVDGRVIQLRTEASSSGVATVMPFSISVQTPPLETGYYIVELLIDDLAEGGGFEVVFRGGFRVRDHHECSEAGCPGATLLFPYFEVDPTDPLGRTTVVAVVNADDEPALTRFVLWTNWGIPVLGLDLFLPASGVRSLHLGSLLASGATPPPAELPPDFPGCPSPLVPPLLDDAALGTLRARLLGKPDPTDGLCYAGTTPAGLLTGYLTVDVVDRCSATARYPGDEGYFVEGNGGVASDRNALSGDWFLIDKTTGQARAFPAVPLRADGAVLSQGTFLPSSFYGLAGDDHRRPLSVLHQSRVLAGSTFATDLILWTEGQRFERYPLGGPLDCGDSPSATWFGFTPRAETPNEDGGVIWWEELTTPLRTQRIDVAALPRDTPAALPIGFGTLRLCSKSRSAFGVLSPPPTYFQTWVGAVFSLGGDFGVSEVATPLNLHGCL